MKLCITLSGENSESLMFSESEKLVEAPTGILPYFAVIKRYIECNFTNKQHFQMHCSCLSRQELCVYF